MPIVLWSSGEATSNMRNSWSDAYLNGADMFLDESLKVDGANW